MRAILSVALASWILASAGYAYAFPTTYHYSVATEPIASAADSFRNWGPEASSDYIVYQRPLDWDAAFWHGSQVFDFTTGSISSKQFLTYQRLKLEQQLTERLRFQLHWLDERDWEQDRRMSPIELKYYFTEKWAASAFFMPSLYKSEDDLGVSLFWHPTPDWEYRASAVWGDFDRNTRNLNSDRWAEAPFGGTVSIRHTPKARPDDFFSVEGHFEPRSRRSLNAPVTDLSYDSIYLSGLHTRESGQRWGLRLLYDRAMHSDYAAGETITRRRALNQFEYSFRMGPHIVKPGLNYFYRESRVNGDQIIFREVLPTVWMDLIPRQKSWGTFKPSIGYDATVFHQQNGDHNDRNLEHRLNLKTSFLFKTAEIGLLFTFDLDQFGSDETWEGGCGQFRMDF